MGQAEIRKACLLDAFTHGDVFGDLIEFLSVRSALRLLRCEGLELADVGTELLFEFFDAGCESNQSV